MKRVIILIAALSTACPPKPAPPPPSSGPTAESVYEALVAANCLAPDDGGAAAVDQEHALPTQEVWLACMYVEGGTVTSCAVPCDVVSPSMRKLVPR